MVRDIDFSITKELSDYIQGMSITDLDRHCKLYNKRIIINHGTLCGFMRESRS